MAKPLPSKQTSRVRFSHPAPQTKKQPLGCFFFGNLDYHSIALLVILRNAKLTTDNAPA